MPLAVPGLHPEKLVPLRKDVGDTRPLEASPRLVVALKDWEADAADVVVRGVLVPVHDAEGYLPVCVC